MAATCSPSRPSNGEAAMSVQSKDLWSLVLERQQIDPEELAEAVQAEASHPELDFRTRLLIRDSIEALRRYWGRDRCQVWLAGSPMGPRIGAILGEPLGKPGFPSLKRRLMETTKPDDLRAYLRELGTSLDKTVQVNVGGSAALILPGLLARRTEDVDVVDEVPTELRAQHRLLNQLKQRYNLYIAHFQSHYLPTGWEQRVHSLEPFGRLRVFLVDPYDVCLSKLFSARAKDLDDLRAVTPQLDKEVLIDRLRRSTASLRACESLLKAAEKNWYILYGESLPA
jgi:hypothetical protein